MPTVRARHMVTETDEIASAINAAAEVWPELKAERAELLRRLIAEGAKSVSGQAATWREQRAEHIRAASGALTGTWPANWRDELRDEWPA